MREVLLISAFIYTAVLGTNFWRDRTRILTNSKHEIHFQKKFKQDMPDILVLGDSRTYFGFSTKIFKEHLNVLNFGFPSLSYTQYVLNKTLDYYSTPKLKHILIAITPQSLSDFETDLSFRKIESSSKEITHFPLLKNALTNLTPRWHILKLIKGSHASNRSSRHPNPLEKNLVFHTNGWIEYNSTAPFSEKRFGEYVRGFEKFKVLNKYTQNLIQFLKKAKQLKINVYFFYPRPDKNIYEVENNPKTSGFVLEKVKQDLIDGGGQWLSTRGPYKTFDGDHYTGQEAKRFTRELLQNHKDLSKLLK